MTAQEFTDWRNRLGISQVQAATALGYRPETVSRFEHGARPIPRVVELACAALETAQGRKETS